MATADNADLWVQPLELADGSITLERGRRVRAVVGGYSVAESDFRIPAPLELRLPFGVRLDEDLLAAVYDVLLHPAAGHADRIARIAVAMQWVTKGWLNTASLSESDQLVFLKTASEALTGETRQSHVAAARLRDLFRGALTQEGEGLGVDALLWSPNEPTFTRTWTKSSGATAQENVTAIEHWYGALADARNDVVHALGSPNLVYEQPGSAYAGPLVEVGDRVMREAICVELGECGYPDVWRRGLTRASMAALRHLRAEAPDRADGGG
ncbi:MAG: hypothetical protein ACRD2W_18600 [Acidimicrobiales bacterium]